MLATSATCFAAQLFFSLLLDGIVVRSVQNKPLVSLTWRKVAIAAGISIRRQETVYVCVCACVCALLNRNQNLRRRALALSVSLTVSRWFRPAVHLREKRGFEQEEEEEAQEEEEEEEATETVKGKGKGKEQEKEKPAAAAAANCIERI